MVCCGTGWVVTRTGVGTVLSSGVAGGCDVQWTRGGKRHREPGGADFTPGDKKPDWSKVPGFRPTLDDAPATEPGGQTPASASPTGSGTPDNGDGAGPPSSYGDVPAPKQQAIIHHESSGNPNAINTWDQNARDGVPSQGLMQTIPPTFDKHHLPGYDKIREPVDNIIAGVLYTYSRYGSLAEHPGIASLERGGGYRPY
ncbi:transglycosylase SLT domain-containing protein [Nonomuraea sp. CA-218870]|uniref:transglycosylase SLT domain-containing protein n=1 Tax=Nonomuraea sp. CA-218870 TaxID=3239998 RepID=UPI003D8B34C9